MISANDGFTTRMMGHNPAGQPLNSSDGAGVGVGDSLG